VAHTTGWRPRTIQARRSSTGGKIKTAAANQRLSLSGRKINLRTVFGAGGKLKSASGRTESWSGHQTPVKKIWQGAMNRKQLWEIKTGSAQIESRHRASTKARTLKISRKTRCQSQSRNREKRRCRTSNSCSRERNKNLGPMQT
jgi:hypothetical protein